MLIHMLISFHNFQLMANGVNGVNILFVLRHVEVEVKQEHVPALILSHLEEENNALDHGQNHRNVIFKHVQVQMVLITLKVWRRNLFHTQYDSDSCFFYDF